MPKAAKKQREDEINVKSWKGDEIKAQVQELVELISSSLENADNKLAELSRICLNKECK